MAIFHDVSLRDGAVELKFKLGKGDDLGIDLVDRQLKTVHAGHLCMAGVSLDRITLTDSKTGHMDLKMGSRNLRESVPLDIADVQTAVPPGYNKGAHQLCPGRTPIRPARTRNTSESDISLGVQNANTRDLRDLIRRVCLFD